MRGVAVRSRKHMLTYAFILGIIFILTSGIVATGSVARANVTARRSTQSDYLTSASCPSAATPTNQSLLVVLLDRSGSLTYEPGATDPNGYSTSATKALADLWPGSMAVVPFSGNNTPILGPATLSDPTARADLKNSVESYPIGGNTPLGPAMHQALKLLQGAAPGSRVIVVTDGNPTGDGNNDGAHQEQDIRQNLLKQFCSQGVPVSAFGLTIDSSTSDGQDANRLLADITSGTNGSYRPVHTPEELARAVIQLYAQWLNLSFIEATVQNGNAPVAVDSSAKAVTILTFRSGNSTGVTLDGPDNQPIQGVQSSQDRHYVIDGLTSNSGVLVPGTYTIHTSNDPDVQVYELVKSTLAIDVTAPTTTQKLYFNKPIEIEARFVDNGVDKQPRPGEAVMYAIVQFTTNGIQGRSVRIPLIQNGAIFKGQTEVYGQAGTLHIQFVGTDQGLQRSNSIDVQLITPPPPPPPPCKLGFWGCTVQPFLVKHLAQVIGFGLLGVLILTLLIWWFIRSTRPKPFGWVSNDRSRVNLGDFRKPTISSTQLQSRGKFNFAAGTRFELFSRRNGQVYIRTARGNSSTITATTGGQTKKVTRQGIELRSGSNFTDGRETASFSNTSGSASSFLNVAKKR